jgi:hypothetical protein
METLVLSSREAQIVFAKSVQGKAPSCQSQKEPTTP